MGELQSAVKNLMGHMKAFFTFLPLVASIGSKTLDYGKSGKAND